LFDIELLKVICDNPDQGLGHLIDQYSGLVYSIIKGKLSSVGTTEDIKECVSDVFIDFYQQIEDIDLERGSIKAYLAILAKHKGIDYYRKLVRAANYSTNCNEDWEQQEDKIHNLEQEIIQKEERRKLLLAIASLGEPDQEIFIRKYYLGQRTKVIARLLGLRDNTVDQKISRGLKKLRMLLGGKDNEFEDENRLAK